MRLSEEEMLGLTTFPADKPRPYEPKGKEFVVICTRHRVFSRGTVVRLTFNDNSSYPIFTSTEDGRERHVNWERLADIPRMRQAEEVKHGGDI